MGRGTYGSGLALMRWGNETISIGNYTSIAQRVSLLAGGGHRRDTVSTFPFDVLMRGVTTGSEQDRCYEHGAGIEIGSDVHLGFGCTVIGSVKIGHGAVIAANATVFSDVPPYAIYGGNPAKFLCWRFEEEWQRKALLMIAWWDKWSEQEIRERIDDFYLPVDEFIRRGNAYSWGVNREKALVHA
jgi:acetyltransferase-like isoleucine patch superfamily enzyme